MTQTEGERPSGETPRATSAVGLIVECDAQPRRIAADPRADLGGVFANARREHQGVQPFQYRGERAEDSRTDAVDEVIDRQPGVDTVAGRQITDALETPESPLRPEWL